MQANCLLLFQAEILRCLATISSRPCSHIKVYNNYIQLGLFASPEPGLSVAVSQINVSDIYTSHLINEKGKLFFEQLYLCSCQEI